MLYLKTPSKLVLCHFEILSHCHTFGPLIYGMTRVWLKLMELHIGETYINIARLFEYQGDRDVRLSESSDLNLNTVWGPIMGRVQLMGMFHTFALIVISLIN